MRADDVVQKAIAAAHSTALAEAMEYLAAHAGYTRVHNSVTGEKDLVKLPGLVAVAYQHETSRCGDPHLHTHVLVPNRQARTDGVLVSIDGTSLYHEARAAGVLYQATLRRELHQSLGIEWAPVDPATGMAEAAGIDRDTIVAWSRRSSQLRSPDQKAAVQNIGESPWLVQPLSAPAGAGKTTSLRALASAAHHRFGASVLVLAPTGQAVDVAMREGAGDDGLTVAKALQSLRDNTLKLNEATLVVIDEAGMVGTDDLRHLLTATTQAGAKTVLVGDASQLAPVKGRGGMFAQLCADLPWTQRLSEVWRMSDPEERTASLALRDGEPTARRDAVDWYRSHDRLHCGDAITMAADALAAYTAGNSLGRDALLVCDTTEMVDALNLRIHNDRIDADVATVTVARGQKVAVGDVIVSRRNDPTIDIRPGSRRAEQPASVRNGNRWRVAVIATDNNQIACARLDDKARAVFDHTYFREHVSLGYAVTVHSAQGVTADASIAVLAEDTSRNLLYVAMTCGRHANHVHIYERTTEASEFDNEQLARTHTALRGASHDATIVILGILANEVPAITAHNYSLQAPEEGLPDRVLDARQAGESY